MNKEQEIKFLLYDLEQYIKEPNESDVNGEYTPPRDLIQEEAKIIVDYIKYLQHQLEEKDKIINDAKEYLIKWGEEPDGDMYYRMNEYKEWNELLEILEGDKNER